MRTPPFLLGAALVFWGWQAGFLPLSLLMALVLEGARFVEVRWDLTESDFSRIWVFCTLLFLGAAVYAFTANGGPADLMGFLENPNFLTQHNASNSSSRTAGSLIRWQPLIFFLFIGAQVFSTREVIPLETISLIFRRRWRRASQAGQPHPGQTPINISYPYVILCLFAASVHPSEDTSFFWGLFVIVVWALWPYRPQRFSAFTRVLALAFALAIGFGGQRALGQLRRWVESYNPAWLARSAGGGADAQRSKTALGSIGRLKSSAQIIIRLEPRNSSPPHLLREASYRIYKGQTWLAGSRSEFTDIAAETNQTSFILLPDKTNLLNDLNIACYLRRGRGLLPVPEGSTRLDELPVFTLQQNSLGALLAQGPGLLIFNARYGPGATIDGPPDLTEDLSQPPREEPAINQVAAELNLASQTPIQALRTISRFFGEKFTYRSWQELDNVSSTNETPLSRFLLRRHSGHCEFFATATVLLLRKAGIPARYAVGYSVHEGSGSKFVVRHRDAHAWCLYWNQEHQIWQDLDTTPASWLEADARGSPSQILADAWSRLLFEISKFRWGQTHLRQYFLWGLVPVLTLLLWQILFRLRRRRRRNRTLENSVTSPWPGLDSEFYLLEQALGRRISPRRAGQSVSDWLSSLSSDAQLIGMGPSLGHLKALHYKYRFDPQGLAAGDRARLKTAAAECLALISAKQQAIKSARSERPDGMVS